MGEQTAETAQWQDTPEKEAWRALIPACADAISGYITREGTVGNLGELLAAQVLNVAFQHRETLRIGGDGTRWFTADEVVEIANETSDSLGNLYRLDFIDRIRHESSANPTPPGQQATS